MTVQASIPATRSNDETSDEPASGRRFQDPAGASHVARSTRRSIPRRVTDYAHAPRWLMLFALAIVLGLTLDASIDKATAAPSVQPVRGTVAYCKRHAVDKAKRACIIRVVFAPIGMASKALRVAECESGLDPLARNGQFRGMFQVSAAWRRDVRGFGALPEQQAWHARRVVTHPEGGWSHWECR